MPDSTTPYTESGNPGETRASATTLGSGRPPARRGKLARRILFALLGLTLLVIAVLLYRHDTAWESTDEAQIDGYIYPVSARVSCYVNPVMVDDNQYVEAGTVLMRLDREDYEVAVANTKATLANDQASAEALLTTVPITSVNTSSQLSSAVADVENAKAGVVAAQRAFDAAQIALRQATANDLKVQDDVTRYQPLAAKDEIPQHVYPQAVDSQKATAATVEAARASAAAAEQMVNQARAKVAQAQAQLQSAETRPQRISVQRSRADAAEAETQRAAAAFD
jgi:membrane fusion protein (multidrug efflux system)